jgi:hypothetical protein
MASLRRWVPGATPFREKTDGSRISSTDDRRRGRRLSVARGRGYFLLVSGPTIVDRSLGSVIRFAVLVKTGIANRNEEFAVGEPVIFTIPKL